MLVEFERAKPHQRLFQSGSLLSLKDTARSMSVRTTRPNASVDVLETNVLLRNCVVSSLLCVWKVVLEHGIQITIMV